MYLFSGLAGYEAYAEDVMGSAPENTAGLYSPALKQLLIWNLPEREQMFLTIRHEGFHQYFDRLVGHSPRWLNEGLAEYYEMIELVGGSWKQGLINSDHRRTLRSETPHHLKTFVGISDRRFFADVGLAYAQSWAFVHFLRHGGRENEALFDRLIDGLIEGALAEEAVDAAEHTWGRHGGVGEVSTGG